MADNRNALAELAEFLKSESAPSSEGLKAKAIESFGIESWKRHEERKRKFYKCSRIIAELAKVRNHECSREPMFFDCKNAIRNCRAIAEEGADDEGK